MRSKIVVLLLCLCTRSAYSRGVNGGINCAVCTVIFGIALQVAQIQEESLFNATTRLCGYFPKWANEECLLFINKTEQYFPYVKYLGADFACVLYGSCAIDSGEEFCHLFPLSVQQREAYEFLKSTFEITEQKIDFCSLPVVKQICDIFNDSFVQNRPGEDIDGDGFSLIYPLRGANWVGKDCDDSKRNVYPGRKPANSDELYDSNCNGIYGVDAKNTKRPWEDVLCNGSLPKGIMYIGDSVGAHFHFPEVWMNPMDINFNISVSGIDAILTELDWPQLGFATGFTNSTDPIVIKGLTDSIYLRLRERNLCNHRDYQNVAKNGASTNDGSRYADNIKRNKQEDYPAIVFYAMVGNDVCNNFSPNVTLQRTTSARRFRSNVLKTLGLLEKKLPVGSHVVLTGLVRADFVYPAMAERIHPIGTLNHNVKYKNVYDWFNCMQIGPCTGWLNGNETLRNLTSQKANALNGVLKEIATTRKFNQFCLYYMENPIDVVVKQQHVAIHQFLEPVDSIHPNQLAQPILADVIWNYLETLPHVLGPVNPNNNRILEIFGDQGGH